MPIAHVRGVNLRYEILGDRGPWVALSPGGRRELEGVKPLAQRIAQGGYQVLIHDRRNCGASDVAFDGSRSEYEIWADDLHVLLSRFADGPAFVGGSSSGCRLAILYALRHPQAVRGLLLWRVTGGRFAAALLAENYYDQYVRLARQGGMAAVCESEHFRDRIAASPANRNKLMAIAPEDFIATMERWRSYFIAGADLPIIGATEADLATIRVPTCIIPGNDRTHSHATGATAHRLIGGSELHDLFPGDADTDLVPAEDWMARDADIAAVFTDFLRRVRAKAEQPA